MEPRRTKVTHFAVIGHAGSVTGVTFLTIDASTVAGKCAKPVFGPLLMLHQKKYVARGAAAELDGVCAAANGAGGLAWLGRAPNARKPPCDWMTQYRGA